MAQVHGMTQVFEQAPHPALQPFIKRFLVVEFAAPHRDAHLPGSGAVAAFSFQGRVRLDGDQWAPLAAFTGLQETLRTHEHSAGSAVLLAMFTPVGAAALIRPALEEFAGTTADFADVLGQPADLQRLHQQLAGAPDHPARVQLAEAFLLARMQAAAPDPLVAAAVAWLEQSAGLRRIDALAQHAGLSQSALERRFRKVVGLSPKKFASLLRLQHAVKLQAAGADLTAVAQAAGYYDQSHFIKDFRRVTGSAPAAFFARAD
jgi:AraC-like DNA-binding protein